MVSYIDKEEAELLSEFLDSPIHDWLAHRTNGNFLWSIFDGTIVFDKRSDAIRFQLASGIEFPDEDIAVSCNKTLQT